MGILWSCCDSNEPRTSPSPDVNECLANPCSQECANIYGSYQCYCRQGYYLRQDGHTCDGWQFVSFFFLLFVFYITISSKLPAGQFNEQIFFLTWFVFPISPPKTLTSALRASAICAPTSAWTCPAATSAPAPNMDTACRPTDAPAEVKINKEMTGKQEKEFNKPQIYFARLKTVAHHWIELSCKNKLWPIVIMPSRGPEEIASC